MCGTVREIYHKLYGAGKNRNETCINLQFNGACKVLNPHWACVGTMLQALSYSEEAYSQLWDIIRDVITIFEYFLKITIEYLPKIQYETFMTFLHDHIWFVVSRILQCSSYKARILRFLCVLYSFRSFESATSS